MGFDLFFINETKKQIVNGKKLSAGFENEDALMCYLSFCQNDVIRIAGENDARVESEVYDLQNHNKEYKYINLYEFNIPEQHKRHNSADVDRLYELVNK